MPQGGGGGPRVKKTWAIFKDLMEQSELQKLHQIATWSSQAYSNYPQIPIFKN